MAYDAPPELPAAYDAPPVEPKPPPQVAQAYARIYAEPPVYERPPAYEQPPSSDIARPNLTLYEEPPGDEASLYAKAPIRTAPLRPAPKHPDQVGGENGHRKSP